MGNFVDHVKITCKAGNGGNGSMSFHREKFVLNGGPDGGDGGNGGNVCFYADLNMHTLLDFRFKSKYTAENGVDGAAGNCTGKRGEDLIIKVPVGTVIREAESGAVVADMDTAGETRTILHGGRGGWGNRHFATPTRQAPNFAKPGIKTEVQTFLLELKTIADVGLVGYPNVGKSTILSVVTSAKPKIGNYHFTTLTPNLGIVRRHGKDIVLADIPGLIEGAADGAGLGHDFLRHVERTRLLLHVLDIAGSEGRDPVEDFDQINHELANYGELAERPQIVVCNKSDLPDSEENVARLKAHLAELGLDYPVFVVSAATHQGFDALLDKTGDMLEALPPIVHFEEEVSYDDSVKPGTFEIVRDGAVFEVVGSSMQRLIDSVNFDDEESMSWFHRTLRKWGVIDALRKAGAHLQHSFYLLYPRHFHGGPILQYHNHIMTRLCKHLNQLVLFFRQSHMGAIIPLRFKAFRQASKHHHYIRILGHTKSFFSFCNDSSTFNRKAFAIGYIFLKSDSLAQILPRRVHRGRINMRAASSLIAGSHRKFPHHQDFSARFQRKHTLIFQQHCRFFCSFFC